MDSSNKTLADIKLEIQQYLSQNAQSENIFTATQNKAGDKIWIKLANPKNICSADQLHAVNTYVINTWNSIKIERLDDENGFWRFEITQKEGNIKSKLPNPKQATPKESFEDILNILQTKANISGNLITVLFKLCANYNSVLKETGCSSKQLETFFEDLCKKIPNSIYLKTAEEDTLLHYAAMCGQPDIIKILVKKLSKEALSCKNIHGQTPIHLSLVNNNKEATQLLASILSEEQLSIQTPAGQTPIQFLANSGWLDILQSIKSKLSPASLAIQDNEKMTAVYFALDKGQDSTAVFLINLMNPVHLLTLTNSHNLLHKALFEKCPQASALLIEKYIDTDKSYLANLTDTGLTPLHIAINQGLLELAKELIRLLPPNQLNIIDKHGYAPLDLAASQGYTEIANLLRKSLSEIKGKTSFNFESILQELKACFSESNILLQNQNDWRSFFLNFCLNYKSIEHIFYNNKDKLNFFVSELALKLPNGEINNTNQTVMHITAYLGHLDLMECLIQSYPKSLLTAKDQTGQTPLLLAADQKQEAVSALILKYVSPDHVLITSDTKPTPLHHFANNGWTSLIKDIINHLTPYQLATKNHQGYMPVCLSLDKEHKEVSALLIDKMHAIHLCQSDPLGYTPTHFAAQYGLLEILKMLIDKCGKEILLYRNDHGHTPLMLAILHKQEHIVEFLTTLDAPHLLTLHDKKGNTPLHIAFYVKYYNKKIATVLLNALPDEALTLINFQGEGAFEKIPAYLDDDQLLPLIKRLSSTGIWRKNNSRIHDLDCIPLHILPFISEQEVSAATMFEAYKRNAVLSLAIEYPETQNYEGTALKPIHSSFLHTLKTFFSNNKLPDWFNSSEIIQTLQEAQFANSLNLSSQLLRWQEGKGKDHEMIYCLTEDAVEEGAHAYGFFKAKDSLFFIDEATKKESAGKNDVSKVIGIKKYPALQSTINILVEYLKDKDQITTQDINAVLNHLPRDEASDFEVDPQWLGNCVVASLRLLTRLLFGEIHKNEKGFIVDKQGQPIPHAEKIISNIYKEYTLAHRLENTNALHKAFQRLSNEKQEQELNFLRMAYAKVLHLAFKRLSFDAILKMATEDWGVPNQKDALLEFFQACLNNPALPWTNKKFPEHIARMISSHKRDFNIAKIQLNKLFG